jgi:uncharacterized membrane protein
MGDSQQTVRRGIFVIHSFLAWMSLCGSISSLALMGRQYPDEIRAASDWLPLLAASLFMLVWFLIHGINWAGKTGKLNLQILLGSVWLVVFLSGIVYGYLLDLSFERGATINLVGFFSIGSILRLSIVNWRTFFRSFPEKTAEV